MVGSLNRNELKDLIDMSSHSFYIEKKSELVAFIVCLRENIYINLKITFILIKNMKDSFI